MATYELQLIISFPEGTTRATVDSTRATIEKEVAKWKMPSGATISDIIVELESDAVPVVSSA